MKKPVEMTAQSVCQLIMEGIHDGGYSGSSGPIKAFTEEAQVSPAVLGLIYRGTFPGIPSNSMEHNRRKYFRGKVFSLTRICDVLGLDLDACLEACNLPKDTNIIKGSRRSVKDRGRGLELEENNIEMLKKQVKVIGPVPLYLVPALVKQFREKGTS